MASFCRSVTISSTVIEPMIERRWPAKIRPVSSDIWSWSDRNRCPALTMDSSSLPTLNAITARTFSEMPCLVTHCLGDLGLPQGQGEIADLAEHGRDEGAVADHHLERRTLRAAPSSGNQHGLVRGRNTVAEHGRSSPKRRGNPGMRGLSPSTSSHSMTSTARAPRDSMTRTVAPLGSGFSDQARKASEPPRILMSTSPGPSPPRVATVGTPTRPTEDSSLATRQPPLSRKCRLQPSPGAGGQINSALSWPRVRIPVAQSPAEARGAPWAGREALDQISIDPADPALFLLSGGTTGIPKLIPRTRQRPPEPALRPHPAGMGRTRLPSVRHGLVFHANAERVLGL